MTTQVYSHHHQVFQGGQEDHGDPWDPINKIRAFRRWLQGEDTESVDKALGLELLEANSPLRKKDEKAPFCVEREPRSRADLSERQQTGQASGGPEGGW